MLCNRLWYGVGGFAVVAGFIHIERYDPQRLPILSDASLSRQHAEREVNSPQ